MLGLGRQHEFCLQERGQHHHGLFAVQAAGKIGQKVLALLLAAMTPFQLLLLLLLSLLLPLLLWCLLLLLLLLGLFSTAAAAAHAAH